MEKLLTTDFRLQGDRNRLIPEGMRDAQAQVLNVYGFKLRIYLGLKLFVLLTI